MTFRLLLRDGEAWNADVLQRLLGSTTYGIGPAGGVGTGYSTGMVGAATQWVVTTVSGRNIQATAGLAIVQDPASTAYAEKAYLATSDATLTATGTANASGTSRTDTICLRIATDASGPAPDATGSNCGTLVIIAGGASNALSNAPADGALYFPLASGVIANGGASYSSFSAGPIIMPAGKAPMGTLPGGYAVITASQAGITTQGDILGLSATVLTGASRRLRITVYCAALSGGNTDVYNGYIFKDGSQIQVSSIVNPTASGYALTMIVCDTPTAGSHTYKVQAARASGAGTGTWYAVGAAPSFILVEDIGGV